MTTDDHCVTRDNDERRRPAGRRRDRLLAGLSEVVAASEDRPACGAPTVGGKNWETRNLSIDGEEERAENGQKGCAKVEGTGVQS